MPLRSFCVCHFKLLPPVLVLTQEAAHVGSDRRTLDDNPDTMASDGTNGVPFPISVLKF